MADWLKAHDSKSCGRFRRLEGSNPFASANRIDFVKKAPEGAFLVV